MATSAEDHKLKGNSYFAQGNYQDAIKEYTIAIIKQPTQFRYFSNRAIAYYKLEDYHKCISDCEKAIDLNSSCTKAYYYLGCSILELDSKRHAVALANLERAYELGVGENSPYSLLLMIAGSIRNAKRVAWMNKDNSNMDLYDNLTNMIIKEYGSESPQSAEMIAQIRKISSRKVPDEFIGKIHFEIMVDPVITPSGITYERGELLQHLAQIGKFDPITRDLLFEKDIIPNRALKKLIDAFLQENGWAVDY